VSQIACQELGVPFRVLDLYRDDWQRVVRDSGADVLLVWPDAFLSIWGQMIKDRVQVVATEMGVPVFPTLPELWLYEDKPRMAYWLQAHDLPQARKRVGMIVGRDTDDLDESGVARAAVESVAESVVDGITAPLLFAVAGGPVAAIVYRAVNTMDSMFGYKNEKYRLFGWAPARLDDLANFVPARLTAPLLAIGAASHISPASARTSTKTPA